MGIIRQGIFGGFENRTGALIGKRINGKNVICALPHKSAKPRSQKQLEQEAKFQLLIRFLRRLNVLIAVGFKKASGKGHAFNAAVKHNFKGMVTGVFPDYYIDCTRLVFSRGSLAPAHHPVASRTGDLITINWQPAAQMQFNRNTDKVMAFAYCPNKDVVVLEMSTATRLVLECEMALPAGLDGLPVLVFMAFVSADGKEVSNSEYLGMV